MTLERDKGRVADIEYAIAVLYRETRDTYNNNLLFAIRELQWRLGDLEKKQKKYGYERLA